jgi:hypothetical protein
VSWLSGGVASGNTEYYRHIVFDNSLAADTYFYSAGMSNGGSFLEQQDNRLPVDTRIFLTPPNALRIQWQSQRGGGWEAEVRVVNFRNRFPEFSSFLTTLPERRLRWSILQSSDMPDGLHQGAGIQFRYRCSLGLCAGAAAELRIEITDSLVGQLEGVSSSPELGYRVTQKLLASGQPFTALFAFNDISAIGAIKALREQGDAYRRMFPWWALMTSRAPRSKTLASRP